MAHEWYSIDELSRQLGRDRRELERLVNRGRIPGRKVGGEWQFHPLEVTQWLEREMRQFSDRQLADVELSQSDSGLNRETPLACVVSPQTVQVPLTARTKRSVLEALIEVAGRTWQVWAPARVLEAVQNREEAMSTAFPKGIAIPHPRNPLPDDLGEDIVVFARTPSGIPFGAPDNTLTDLFFLVLCRETRTHLTILARLGRLLQMPGFLARLRSMETSEEAFEAILEAERQLVMPPPPHRS